MKESRDASHILFGLKLQPENSWKTMIVGPSANDTVMVKIIHTTSASPLTFIRFQSSKLCGEKKLKSEDSKTGASFSQLVRNIHIT